MAREQDLVATFIRLADTLVDEFDVVELLHHLAEQSVALLDATAAGIVLADTNDSLRVMAASSEQAHRLELFQVQNERGPCLECYRTGEAVTERDLGHTAHWPSFSSLAVEQGFRSVVALPLRLRRETVGTLNLFRATTGSLTESEMLTGQGLADIATISILQERALHDARIVIQQLHTALNNRVVLEQAKGMVAERAAVDMQQAFTILRAHARNHNLLLTDVAREVAAGRLRLGDPDPDI